MRIIFGIIFIAGLLFTVTPTQAQSPPPPPPAEHGVDGNSNPRGAPIDGGLGILLALGAAYGGKKLYQAYKEKKESSEEETDEVT